jgi:hypothetical protein
MNNIRATVQRITEDLNVLMRQLSAADDAQAREFVEQMLTSELLADFKGSVDAMRHLMWIYVEAISKSDGPSTIVQSARLRRAVDMLRSLHESPAPEHLAGPETFFERMQNVVDGYEMKPALAKKRDAA